MGWLKKNSLVLFVVTLVSGCVTGIDANLASNVGLFEAGVRNMRVVVRQHFDNTENASRRALEDNLHLQFDLGGSPLMDLPPLFKTNDRLARAAILEALSIYSGRLSKVVAGHTRPEDLRKLSNQLEGMNTDAIDVSHSLNSEAADTLVSSLSGLSKLLLSPKINEELSLIVNNAHPYVERVASLLYLDMGSTEDQSDACEEREFKDIKFQGIREIELCIGGLRELMAMSIAANVITWQQRLSLASVKIPVDAVSRRQYVSKILILQQAGQKQDSLMEGTQHSLIQLVEAHLELKNALNGDSNPALTPMLDPAGLDIGLIGVFANNASSLLTQVTEASKFFN